MLPQFNIEMKDIVQTVGINKMMTVRDRMAIVALLKDIKARRVIEFGVHEGFTAKVVLDNVPSVESYIGIDVPISHTPNLERQCHEIPSEPGKYVKSDARFRVIVKEGGSFAVAPSDIGSADAALIDGDHSAIAVTNDTAVARSCVRLGGILIWHDYWHGDETEVKPTLEKWEKNGHRIFHVPGTWIAFERVQ